MCFNQTIMSSSGPMLLIVLSLTSGHPLFSARQEKPQCNSRTRSHRLACGGYNIGNGGQKLSVEVTLLTRIPSSAHTHLLSVCPCTMQLWIVQLPSLSMQHFPSSIGEGFSNAG
ncbi:hypothetical protein KC19_1G192700 [Ceratodon purpureus]|uniref:Secreted protein n=1 Tax=Ceratodon purpureus TaxID=3225 RepID=A0A8T0J9U4_CERPU|nr:hypothetical protein KC19_1G192700 [Ceratodon purpureus]